MREKILIYPFDRESMPIINYSSMLEEQVDIVSLVSLSGWGLVGEEYPVGDRSLMVEDNFENQLERCTMIWFVETLFDLDFREYFVGKIKYAVACNKKILITRGLNAESQEIVKSIVPQELLVKINDDYAWEELSPHRIYDINTPIILVCGLFKGTMKFDVQMELRKELLKQGVKLLQIGTKKYSKLFGINPIPDFMFNNSISEKDKILRFNHYLKLKELEERYDAILLGIPGELAGLKSNVFDELGVYAFEMLRAISPDCVVLCLPYEENIVQKRKVIAKSIEEVFQINIDYFNIVPFKIDIEQSEAEKSISYLEIEKNFIIKDINKKDVFCVSDEGNGEVLANAIIAQLSEYGKHKMF